MKAYMKSSVLAPLIFAYAMVISGVFAALPFRSQSALAQSQPMPPAGILVATTDQGIRYVVGGVGADERKMMEQLGAAYNVKFVFADASGDYLSDVAVQIAELHGKSVAHLVTNGPWLYVRLPAGGYRVQATHAAKTREIQRLEVPKTDGVVMIVQVSF